MKKLGYFAPLIVLAVIAGVFLIRLVNPASDDIGNAMANKSVPAFPSNQLEAFAVDDDVASIIAENDVTLVNYFASWCAPCRAEHPVLKDIAQSGIPVVGINYKDQSHNATKFIEELGNPYRIIFVDDTGRTAIDWGVSGVPETFIVNREGVIVDRVFGQVTSANLDLILTNLGVR